MWEQDKVTAFLAIIYLKNCSMAGNDKVTANDTYNPCVDTYTPLKVNVSPF